jgi:hypothetical protein
MRFLSRKTCWVMLAIINAAYVAWTMISHFLGLEINVLIMILDLVGLACSLRHLKGEAHLT